LLELLKLIVHACIHLSPATASKQQQGNNPPRGIPTGDLHVKKKFLPSVLFPELITPNCQSRPQWELLEWEIG